MPELGGTPPRKGRGERDAPAAEGRRGSGELTAADCMVREVVTVGPETSIEEVSELFQVRNIHGAPVVDDDGRLVGIVTEDDLVFGQMGFSDAELEMMEREPSAENDDAPGPRRVAELMTHHPIAVQESTTLREICNLISRLRIHRLPVLRDGRVSGIVSSVDVCRLVAEGRARLERS